MSETKTNAIAVGSRGVQLTTIEDAMRFATAVHQSGLAPRGFRTPQAILVAIEYGAELGLKPMQALASIAVVNGKPSLYGDGLKAIVEASPECESVIEQIDGEGDAMIATCTAKRRGRDVPTVRTFSMSDAKRAGLLGKDGPWRTYPARMLQMRARAFALRDQFADLLCGLGVVEEQADIEPRRGLQSGDEQPSGDMDLIAEAAGAALAEDQPLIGSIVEQPAQASESVSHASESAAAEETYPLLESSESGSQEPRAEDTVQQPLDLPF